MADGVTGVVHLEPEVGEKVRGVAGGIGSDNHLDEITRPELMEARRTGDIALIHSWEIVTAVDGRDDLPRVNECDIAGATGFHKLRARDFVQVVIRADAASDAADFLADFRLEVNDAGYAICHCSMLLANRPMRPQAPWELATATG